MPSIWTGSVWASALVIPPTWRPSLDGSGQAPMTDAGEEALLSVRCGPWFPASDDLGRPPSPALLKRRRFGLERTAQ
jgi:hypothetical protein